MLKQPKKRTEAVTMQVIARYKNYSALHGELKQLLHTKLNLF